MYVCVCVVMCPPHSSIGRHGKHSFLKVYRLQNGMSKVDIRLLLCISALKDSNSILNHY